MTLELSSQYIFAGAILALLCVMASFVSRKVGAPLLLVFLILGMLAGEDGPGNIQFDDFGLAFLLGNLALAIIIFDGGLGTRRETFRVSLKPALSLATVGVVLTAGIAGAAAHWILQLPLYEALLLGAIIGSTDAAAVFGLLRSAGFDLKERTGSTLEIESGTNDPMAIFLTVTLVEILATANDNPGIAVLTSLIQQMGLGLVLGYAGGRALAWLIKRLHLSASLYPLFALAGGLSIFGLTNLWGGSGFLAIYLVGMIVGNAPLPYSNDIHRFHDGIAWLSQIGMFLMLGLLITPSNLPAIWLPAVAIALVLTFVARPVAVFASLLPFHFPWREQLFVSWCGLRGAVPIILALFPPLAGLEHTRAFFDLVFFVVLISLVLQGWTITPLARWLRINLPPTGKEPEHFKFPLAEEYGKSLHFYEAVPNCEASGMQTNRLPLSKGAQLAGVLRQGLYISPSQAREITSGDLVMILTSDASDSVGALFRGPDSKGAPTTPDFFFGEFAISPEITLGELSQAYGLKIPAEQKQVPVAQYLDAKFHGKSVVGDCAELDNIQLIVRATNASGTSAVGLKLHRDNRK